MQLCDGPALSEEKGGAGGFFYEFFLKRKADQQGQGGEEGGVSTDEFTKLEKRMESLVKNKQPFERMAVSKEFAMQVFAHNQFKRYYGVD